MIVLKPKELAVLKLVCQEKTALEIAAKMACSTRTIEKTKAKLRLKTKSKSDIGLLKWAVINDHYVLKTNLKKSSTDLETPIKPVKKKKLA